MLVNDFIRQQQPGRLVAYTRNPSLLRLLEQVSGCDNVLEHDNPDAVATTIANATTGPDNNLYHIGRYAPNGLYGLGHDPATRLYYGVPLVKRCILLADPNNALAVSVSIHEREV